MESAGRLWTLVNLPLFSFRKFLSFPIKVIMIAIFRKNLKMIHIVFRRPNCYQFSSAKCFRTFFFFKVRKVD